MKVAIRADAYPQLGTGHVMRCIALGQGLRESGCEVVFITFSSSEGLVSRLKNEGFCLYLLNESGSLKESMKIFEKENPDWIVLDGYHFDASYQNAVKDAGYRLLVIDDYVRLDYYHADIIVNQNYGSEEFHYNTGEGSILLLGVKYVMLRNEFLKYRRFDRKSPEYAEKVLITMGGADPANNTLKVLKAANLIESPLKVKVVVGAANPHYELLAKEAAGSRHEIEILQGVADMAPLMAWADMAISAGGSTVWELAFMGVPAVLCIVADNQENAVNNLENEGIFKSIAKLHERTIEEIANVISALISDNIGRIDMSLKAKAVVDGKGVFRVFNAMRGNPLKILFLGGNSSCSLSDWLESMGELVFFTENKVDADYVKRINPDIIVSYNYKHILSKEVLAIPRMRAINLHISYLPWNRGAHPNVWSFIENTPNGVTIHYIDEGVDTGDIILQKEVSIAEDRATLKTSYEKLHEEIQTLFKSHWAKLKFEKIKSRKQRGSGTVHYKKDAYVFEQLIAEKGWDIPVRELKK